MIMTERECHILALEHKETPWVANKRFQDICMPSCILEGAVNKGHSVDWFGVHYITRPDQPGPFPVEKQELYVIQDMEDWEDQLKFPDLDKVDWAAAAEKDTATWDREGRLSSCTLINGMLESLECFAGFENALCYLITNEEEVKAFNQAVINYKIALIERLHKYYKPDKIQLHDDYANQTQLFMNIDTWRRLYKPYLKQLVDAVHSMGMYYEHHSCGFVSPLYDDFVELGVDCTNPVQFCNGPYELQKKYEDTLTLVGCFDKQGILEQEDSTPEQIQAHLREVLYTMSQRRSWIADVRFIDKSRNHLWEEIIDEFNRPLYEKAGVTPRREADATHKNVFAPLQALDTAAQK